ncbi:MAG: Gfo/Idh/MocA family oxidoreductase [Planctomycetaceae bacterium]|nr:Gfo/Idh/MocA family oxidoreductase [Planctomycetaceae bacterium]
MNVLVVGVGSIGSRHLGNLAALGHRVWAVDTSAAQLEKVRSQAVGTFTSLDEALRQIKPEAAFICTFSNAHVAPALQLAMAGCHLFIEKPLSVTLDGIASLAAAAAQHRLVTMVGCNMRFHPAVAAIHKTLTENPAFAKPLWAGIEFGYSLKIAKPNYQDSYMARRSLGGNLIFDVIHELDYAAWMLGPARSVMARRGIVSDMKIDTEDHVDMMIRFASGAAGVIHMDYLQHGYSRRCKIVAEGGTIVWDFAAGTLGTITAQNPQWTWQDLKLDIYYNQMYLDEAKYFMDAAAAKRPTFNDIAAATDTLKLALAANRSCESGQWESCG